MARELSAGPECTVNRVGDVFHDQLDASGSCSSLSNLDRVLFPTTSGNWAVKTLSGVPLTSGTNTIAITKDWGYIDVDWIEITP